jgi:hypothetical protein
MRVFVFGDALEVAKPGKENGGQSLGQGGRLLLPRK